MPYFDPADFISALEHAVGLPVREFGSAPMPVLWRAAPVWVELVSRLPSTRLGQDTDNTLSLSPGTPFLYPELAYGGYPGPSEYHSLLKHLSICCSCVAIEDRTEFYWRNDDREHVISLMRSYAELAPLIRSRVVLVVPASDMRRPESARELSRVLESEKNDIFSEQLGPWGGPERYYGADSQPDDDRRWFLDNFAIPGLIGTSIGESRFGSLVCTREGDASAYQQFLQELINATFASKLEDQISWFSMTCQLPRFVQRLSSDEILSLRENLPIISRWQDALRSAITLYASDNSPFRDEKVTAAIKKETEPIVRAMNADLFKLQKTSETELPQRIIIKFAVGAATGGLSTLNLPAAAGAGALSAFSDMLSAFYNARERTQKIRTLNMLRAMIFEAEPDLEI